MQKTDCMDLSRDSKNYRLTENGEKGEYFATESTEMLPVEKAGRAKRKVLAEKTIL